MVNKPHIHHQGSRRLKGYDYTQPGAYFITICTQDRKPIFGEIVDSEMRLSACGKIARNEWFYTAILRPNVQLHWDEFVVMPDHVHGIVWIVGDDAGADAWRRRASAENLEQFGKPVTGSIPTIVRAYKSAVTYRIRSAHATGGEPVWQRNYYEHVIRNEAE